jgi:hypothetical protein
VYVALAGPDVSDVREVTFTGDRAAIRTGSVAAALALLAECIPAPPRG